MTSAMTREPLRVHILSDRFRPFPHVAWVRLADAAVLLDAERGLYYTLNEVASRVWALLAAGEPLIEILRCLGDEFDAPDETLETDTAAVLERLLDAGLIERIAP